MSENRFIYLNLLVATQLRNTRKISFTRQFLRLKFTFCSLFKKPYGATLSNTIVLLKVAPYGFLKSEQNVNFNLKNCISLFWKRMKLKLICNE